MKLKVISAAVLFAVAATAGAEEAPKKPWKNSTELSAVSANGNTKSQSGSVKDTFNYEWKSKTVLELIGSALGASNQGSTTAEKYSASEKLTQKFSEKNYGYQKFVWDKDRFAGIRGRYDNNVGMGRELIKSPVNFLIGEVGVGYIEEYRINDDDEEFTSGRAYSKYVWTISPTSNFSQDAEYLHNFENRRDFRVNTETAITAAINTAMSLKLSYVWKHVGEPPRGFGRNDTTTTVALVATY